MKIKMNIRMNKRGHYYFKFFFIFLFILLIQTPLNSHSAQVTKWLFLSKNGLTQSTPIKIQGGLTPLKTIPFNLDHCTQLNKLKQSESAKKCRADSNKSSYSCKWIKKAYEAILNSDSDIEFPINFLPDLNIEKYLEEKKMKLLKLDIVQESIKIDYLENSTFFQMNDLFVLDDRAQISWKGSMIRTRSSFTACDILENQFLLTMNLVATVSNIPDPIEGDLLENCWTIYSELSKQIKNESLHEEDPYLLAATVGGIIARQLIERPLQRGDREIQVRDLFAIFISIDKINNRIVLNDFLNREDLRKSIQQQEITTREVSLSWSNL